MKRRKKEAEEEPEEAEEAEPEQEEEEEERPAKKTRSTAKGSARSSAKRDLAASSKSQKRDKGTSARRAAAPSGGSSASEARKMMAVKATGAVFVLFVIIAVYTASKPEQIPPVRKVTDYPAKIAQAKKYCEDAARKFNTAKGEKESGQKDAAFSHFKEAIALLDQAQALYEEVSNASPGPEYDYISQDIDRMMLERKTYRTMMGELDRH